MKIKIYRIVDPDTHTPVYIGQTMHELGFRLSSHLSSPNNMRFGEWVTRVKKKGKRPIIELIEEVSENRANKREQFWIDQYREMGFSLTNCKNNQPHTRKKRE